MRKLPPLVFGIFLVFTAAWFGVVGYSYLQLGRMQPVVDENTGASKIARNRARDAAAVHALGEAGWRCLTVWECGLKDEAALSALVPAGHPSTPGYVDPVYPVTGRVPLSGFPRA